MRVSLDLQYWTAACYHSPCYSDGDLKEKVKGKIRNIRCFACTLELVLDSDVKFCIQTDVQKIDRAVLLYLHQIPMEICKL